MRDTVKLTRHVIILTDDWFMYEVKETDAIALIDDKKMTGIRKYFI
jgi:hypothetical protein